MSVSPVVAAEHRHRVGKILVDPRLTTRGRALALWNYIFRHEITNGTQFLATSDGGLYAVLGDSNQVIPLPRAARGGDRWFSYFHTKYGLSEREEHTQALYAVFRHYAMEHGTKVELRRFAAVKPTNFTGYLSSYDGQMYQIESEDEITKVPNGTDGVFFADDDWGCPCEPDIGPHGELLDRLTDLNFAPSGLSGITPAQQKMALVVWLFALGLPDLMPTKPIMLIEGVKGSGKTAAPSLAQLVLMGEDKAMMLQRNKEDDFLVILLRSPIALFDNTDSYIEWVPDAVAAYCTGVGLDKRRLYSDDESVRIKPQAFIAISTRNPASFRRDDVADRCLILRLERRATFMSWRQLKRQMLDARPRLFGEYLWFLGRILRELRTMHAEGEEFGLSETHRMADFAALATIVGRVVGWEPEAVAGMLDAMEHERDAFINEEDPLVDLLQKWATYTPRNGPANLGRLISGVDLHSELNMLAQAGNTVFKESPRSLGQKLRSSHIEQEFHVEMVPVRGQKMYCLRRHGESKLQVVV